MPESDSPSQRLLRLTGWGAFVVLGTSGAWFITYALLPWELGYTYDPATGEEHGPWVPWQFLVCGILILTIAVTTSWSRYWPTVLLLPPSLTLAWSVIVSREDMTGLWMIGLIYMMFASTVGTLFVLAVTRSVRDVRLQRRSSLQSQEPPTA